MSERSIKLLALYEVLMEQVKLQYKKDNSLTVKGLFDSVTTSKDYLLLKEDSNLEELDLVEQFLNRDIASFVKEQNDASLVNSPTFIAVENTFWHWLGRSPIRVKWNGTNYSKILNTMAIIVVVRSLTKALWFVPNAAMK